jgi:hypothetical protein
MLKQLTFALIITASLVSCKSKSAFNYSQSFVQKERSLNNDIETTEAKVEKYVTLEQFDSIGAAGERMEKLVDTKIKEIEDEAAPDVKEGANFKKAGLEYFQFIKSLYTGYREYGYAKTPEERDEKLMKIKELVDKKKIAIADIQRAQQKYADANGFTVENK